MNLFKKSLIGIFASLFLFVFASNVFADNQRSFIINIGGGMITDGYEEINASSFFAGDIITFLGELEFSGMGSATGHMTGAIVGQSTTKNIIPLQTLPIAVPVNGFNSFTVPSAPGNYLARFVTTSLGSTDTYDFPFTVLGTTPTLTNTTSSSVTSTGATLGANVTAAGNPSTISTRGVCYGLTSSSMTTCLNTTGTLGVYTVPVSSLLSSTKYYYRGYATNATGTGYSPTLSFVTLAPPITLDVLATPATILSGGVSTISWNSEGADACILSGGGISGSGVDNTGVLTNPITASTTYSVTCTSNPETVASSCTGTYTGMSQSCVGTLAGNTCGFDETEDCGIFTAAGCYLPSDPWCHHACHVLTTYPTGLLCSQYNSSQSNCTTYNTCVWNPSYSVPAGTITKTVTVSPNSFNVELTKLSTKIKNIVKANNFDPIGSAYLNVYISGIPSGKTCDLKNVSVPPPSNPIIESYSIDQNDHTVTVKDLKNENSFQIICNDSNNTKSSIVPIKGQSGTLDSSNPSCTIASGASSCNLSALWTTVNPFTATNTEIKNFFNNISTYVSGTSGNVSLSIPGNISTGSSFGTVLFKSFNKVDSETNNIPSPASNELDNLTVDVYCADGTLWNGTICAPSVGGNIDSTNCIIASGASTCQTSLTWTTANPIGTSNVTSDYPAANTVVATGNNGTNVPAAVPYPSRNFYLNNNAAGLDQTTAYAVCVTGTVWTLGKCVPNATMPSGNLIISPSSCTIALGASTCTTTGATWTTANTPDPTKVSLVDANTGSVLSTLANNSTPLKVWVAYPQTVFNLKYLSGILDTKTATATCVAGSIWDGAKCAAKIVPTGTLTATNCTIPAGASNCNTTLVWNTVNPIPTADPSAVVTPTNIIVARANSGTKTYSITFETRNFFLYHNAVQLDQAQATAVCEDKTDWNVSKGICEGVAVDLPDLTASDPTPITAVLNTPVVFTSTISNKGNASTGIKFINLFQTSTSPDGSTNLVDHPTDAMPPLDLASSNVATSEPITFNQNISYYVRACADKDSAASSGDINESDEGNNCSNWSKITISAGVPANGVCAVNHYNCSVGTSISNVAGATTWTWTCQGSNGGTDAYCSQSNGNLPDLTASSPTQSAAIVGVPTNFTSTISNIGTVTTGATFYNMFQVASAANGGGAITNLSATPSPMAAVLPSAGVTATSSLYTFPSVGTYSIRACADNNISMIGTINEGINEDNNCSASWTNVTVTPTANIDLTASSPTPNSAVVNTSVVFTSTISNIGNTTTSIGFNNFFQVASATNGGGVIIDKSSTSMSAIVAGGTRTASTSHTFSSEGTYSVRACADKSSSANLGVISESNVSGTGELNNCSGWTNVTITTAAVAINGVCGATHNICGIGSNVNIHEDASFWYWDCLGQNGGATDTCQESKIVAPPGVITINFTASPTQVLKGKASTLTWTSTNATSCSSADFNFAGEGTATSVNGSAKVFPTTSPATTYSLTCTDGTSPVSSSATVKVIVPVIIEN